MSVQEAAIRWEAARLSERQAREALSVAIREARAGGASLAQLAAELGISRQRVEQLSKS